MVNAPASNDASIDEDLAAHDREQRPVLPASRLSAWCDRVIEMGWLAAIIVVPLFFNIYSSRVFEPDKLTTLRSIAIVMALVWLVKWLEERGNPNSDTRLSWRTPLVIPTLIMVVAYMVSTAFSVAPRTSLLGSYQRLQGTYTTFAYIVIFVMVLQGLRTRAQLERLLTVTILSAFPVAYYGVLQRMEIDPLPWGGDTVQRVAGNMGNSIFVAAYLIMTFFLTIYKIADAVMGIVRADKNTANLLVDVLRAACYIVIAIVNTVVIALLAGSRGPQLGWFSGIAFMAMLMVQLLRNRKLRLALTAVSIGGMIASLAFLVWLNTNRLSPTATKLRQQSNLIERMSSVFTTSEGTNLVRALIWKGVVRMVAPHEPLQNPDGSADRWNAIRPLVGYGPESMYVAYNRFYPPELANIEARNASPDRSHNETWDSLVITGIFGFLAYMLLFGSTLYFGFRWIGLIRKPYETWLFVLLWIGGAGAAAAFAVSSDQSNLLGILVALGIMLGLILFLFISALTNSLRGEEEASVQHLTLRSRMLIIAIIATVVAHFGEIHTGIAIASTRTHFWIWIAAMVVLGAGYLREQTAVAAAAGVEQAAPAPVAEPAQSAGGTRRQRRAAAATASRRSVRATPSGRGWLPTWSRPVLGAGALLFLMMGILSFDFVNNIQRYDVPGRVFIASMTELPPLAPARPVSVPSNGVLYMFLSTLLLGTVMFSTELYRNRQLETAGNIAPAAALIASIGAFGWVSFGTLLAGQLTAFITAAPNTLNGVLDVAGQLAQLPVFVYALILIAMLLGARFLRNEEGVQVPRGTTGMAGWLTGMIGGVLSLFMISSSNLQPIQADIIYKLAGNWDQRASGFIVDPRVPIQGWDMAIEHHRKAIQLAPNEDFYYLWLGRALLEKASSHPNPAQAGGKVAENDPFDKIVTDGPQNWGEVTRESLPSVSLSQQDLLNAAKIILERAREINPLNTDHSANLARMWSKTTSIVSDPAERSRRTENSLREYQAATTLSPNNAQIFNEWANVFITDKKYDEARRLLDKSIEIDKKFDSTRLLRASIYLRQADELNQQRAAANQLQATLPTTETVKIAEAKSVVDRVEPQWREALRKALPELEAALGINKDNTQTLGQLVLTYQQLGEIDKAIGYAQKVATLTPNDWTAYRNLALLYNEGKQKDKAVSAAQQALSFAPADQQPGLQAFIEQIKAQP